MEPRRRRASDDFDSLTAAGSRPLVRDTAHAAHAAGRPGMETRVSSQIHAAPLVTGADGTPAAGERAVTSRYMRSRQLAVPPEELDAKNSKAYKTLGINPAEVRARAHTHAHPHAAAAPVSVSVSESGRGASASFSSASILGGVKNALVSAFRTEPSQARAPPPPEPRMSLPAAPAHRPSAAPTASPTHSAAPAAGHTMAQDGGAAPAVPYAKALRMLGLSGAARQEEVDAHYRAAMVSHADARATHTHARVHAHAQPAAAAATDARASATIARLSEANVFLAPATAHVSVRIMGASMRQDSRSHTNTGEAAAPQPRPSILASLSPPYAVYLIRMQSGSRVWTVQRRYREFTRLHEALCRAVPSHKMPALPGRMLGVSRLRMFQDSDLVLRRVTELQAYLRLVIRITEAWSCDKLLEFLDDSRTTLQLQANFARAVRMMQAMAVGASAAERSVASRAAMLSAKEAELAALQARVAELASQLADTVTDAASSEPDAADADADDADGFVSAHSTDDEGAAARTSPAAAGALYRVPAPERASLGSLSRMRSFDDMNIRTSNASSVMLDSVPLMSSLMDHAAYASYQSSRRAISFARKLRGIVGDGAALEHSALSTARITAAALQSVSERAPVVAHEADVVPALSTALLRSYSYSGRSALARPGATGGASKRCVSMDHAGSAHHREPRDATQPATLAMVLTDEDIDDVVSVIFGSAGLGDRASMWERSFASRASISSAVLAGRGSTRSFTHSFVSALFRQSIAAPAAASHPLRMRMTVIGGPGPAASTTPPSPSRRRRALSESDVAGLAAAVAALMSRATGVPQDAVAAPRGDVPAAPGPAPLDHVAAFVSAPPASLPALVTPERYCIPGAAADLARDADRILCAIGPSVDATERRQEIATFVSRLLRHACALEAVQVGTTVNNTYLPDAPIDMLVVLPACLQRHPWPLHTPVVTPAIAAPAHAPAAAPSAASGAGEQSWFVRVNEVLCRASMQAANAGRSRQPHLVAVAGDAAHHGSKSDAAFAVLSPSSPTASFPSVRFAALAKALGSQQAKHPASRKTKDRDAAAAEPTRAEMIDLQLLQRMYRAFSDPDFADNAACRLDDCVKQLSEAAQLSKRKASGTLAASTVIRKGSSASALLRASASLAAASLIDVAAVHTRVQRSRSDGDLSVDHAQASAEVGAHLAVSATIPARRESSASLRSSSQGGTSVSSRNRRARERARRRAFKERSHMHLDSEDDQENDSASDAPGVDPATVRRPSQSSGSSSPRRSPERTVDAGPQPSIDLLEDAAKSSPRAIQDVAGLLQLITAAKTLHDVASSQTDSSRAVSRPFAGVDAAAIVPPPSPYILRLLAMLAADGALHFNAGTRTGTAADRLHPSKQSQDTLVQEHTRLASGASDRSYADDRSVRASPSAQPASDDSDAVPTWVFATDGHRFVVRNVDVRLLRDDSMAEARVLIYCTVDNVHVRIMATDATTFAECVAPAAPDDTSESVTPGFRAQSAASFTIAATPAYEVASCVAFECLAAVVDATSLAVPHAAEDVPEAGGVVAVVIRQPASDPLNLRHRIPRAVTSRQLRALAGAGFGSSMHDESENAPSALCRQFMRDALDIEDQTCAAPVTGLSKRAAAAALRVPCVAVATLPVTTDASTSTGVQPAKRFSRNYLLQRTVVLVSAWLQQEVVPQIGSFASSASRAPAFSQSSWDVYHGAFPSISGVAALTPRAVTSLLISIVVEAARNAVPRPASGPCAHPWQRFLPLSGVFTSPLQLFSSFVGICATVDFSDTVFSYAGICDRSRFQRLCDASGAVRRDMDAALQIVAAQAVAGTVCAAVATCPTLEARSSRADTLSMHAPQVQVGPGRAPRTQAATRRQASQFAASADAGPVEVHAPRQRSGALADRGFDLADALVGDAESLDGLTDTGSRSQQGASTVVAPDASDVGLQHLARHASTWPPGIVDAATRELGVLPGRPGTSALLPVPDPVLLVSWLASPATRSAAPSIVLASVYEACRRQFPAALRACGVAAVASSGAPVNLQAPAISDAALCVMDACMPFMNVCSGASREQVADFQRACRAAAAQLNLAAAETAHRVGHVPSAPLDKRCFPNVWAMYGRGDLYRHELLLHPLQQHVSSDTMRRMESRSSDDEERRRSRARYPTWNHPQCSPASVGSRIAHNPAAPMSLHALLRTDSPTWIPYLRASPLLDVPHVGGRVAASTPSLSASTKVSDASTASHASAHTSAASGDESDSAREHMVRAHEEAVRCVEAYAVDPVPLYLASRYVDAVSHRHHTREGIVAVAARAVATAGVIPLGVLGSLMKMHVGSAPAVVPDGVETPEGAPLTALGPPQTAGSALNAVIRHFFFSLRFLLNVHPSTFMLAKDATLSPCVALAGHAPLYPFLLLPAGILATAHALVKVLPSVESYLQRAASEVYQVVAKAAAASTSGQVVPVLNVDAAIALLGKDAAYSTDSVRGTVLLPPMTSVVLPSQRQRLSRASENPPLPLSPTSTHATSPGDFTEQSTMFLMTVPVCGSDAYSAALVASGANFENDEVSRAVIGEPVLLQALQTAGPVRGQLPVSPVAALLSAEQRDLVHDAATRAVAAASHARQRVSVPLPHDVVLVPAALASDDVVTALHAAFPDAVLDVFRAIARQLAADVAASVMRKLSRGGTSSVVRKTSGASDSTSMTESRASVSMTELRGPAAMPAPLSSVAAASVSPAAAASTKVVPLSNAASLIAQRQQQLKAKQRPPETRPGADVLHVDTAAPDADTRLPDTRSIPPITAPSDSTRSHASTATDLHDHDLHADRGEPTYQGTQHRHRGGRSDSGASWHPSSASRPAGASPSARGPMQSPHSAHGATYARSPNRGRGPVYAGASGGYPPHGYGFAAGGVPGYPAMMPGPAMMSMQPGMMLMHGQPMYGYDPRFGYVPVMPPSPGNPYAPMYPRVMHPGMMMAAPPSPYTLPSPYPMGFMMMPGATAATYGAAPMAHSGDVVVEPAAVQDGDAATPATDPPVVPDTSSDARPTAPRMCQPAELGLPGRLHGLQVYAYAVSPDGVHPLLLAENGVVLQSVLPPEILEAFQARNVTGVAEAATDSAVEAAPDADAPSTPESASPQERAPDMEPAPAWDPRVDPAVVSVTPQEEQPPVEAAPRVDVPSPPTEATHASAAAPPPEPRSPPLLPTSVYAAEGNWGDMMSGDALPPSASSSSPYPASPPPAIHAPSQSRFSNLAAAGADADPDNWRQGSGRTGGFDSFGGRSPRKGSHTHTHTHTHAHARAHGSPHTSSHAMASPDRHRDYDGSGHSGRGGHGRGGYRGDAPRARHH